MIIDKNSCDEKGLNIRFTYTYKAPKAYGICQDEILADVAGRVYKKDPINESYCFEGKIKTSVSMICCSCLEECIQELDIDFIDEFATITPEDYDVFLYTGSKIDLTPALDTNILLNIPVKALCSDGCKGLCNICGTNLNKSKCGCENISYDPRFEVLRSLLKDEEV